MFCHCLKTFPLPPLPPPPFLPSLFFLSHVIERMNAWRQAFLCFFLKTNLGEERYRELEEEGTRKEIRGKHDWGKGREAVGWGGHLAFQPFSQWLGTCSYQWLRGDLWPQDSPASGVVSALIRKPHDSTLGRASDLRLQMLRVRPDLAEGTTDVCNDWQTHTQRVRSSTAQRRDPRRRTGHRFQLSVLLLILLDLWNWRN